ncbi:MAG: hypothetical protein AAGM67_00925 [Bacteroidota bacterium]
MAILDRIAAEAILLGLPTCAFMFAEETTRPTETAPSRPCLFRLIANNLSVQCVVFSSKQGPHDLVTETRKNEPDDPPCSMPILSQALYRKIQDASEIQTRAKKELEKDPFSSLQDLVATK